MNTTPDTSRPVLIYDGECGFCTYWARYWQKLTGEAVQYHPYQQVAFQYPSIPVEEFRRAVQYVSTKGEISSAAKASFLTLSHAPGKNFWLSLYRRVPGFAFIAEKSYAFIAAHREAFFKLSLVCYGRDYEPPRFDLVSSLFLRLLGILFLVAFISFGSQALGLIGSHGIIPVTDLAEAARNQLGIERYWLLPMVFWLQSSDFFIQAVCWTGIVSSILVIFKIFPRINLIILYLLYLSLIQAGQVFMSFQWDLFLLETGVICIFLIGTTRLGIWLLRWLLFRFMFAGGLVKLLTGDSAWTDFSALNYYFFTEPLPTPLAWYANLLPQKILAAGTALTLVIELIIPFLIFFPRHFRFFAAFVLLIFQFTILITGNYNFFNLLTMSLCLVLFDDAAIRKIIPTKLSHLLTFRKKQNTHPIMIYIGGCFAALTISVSLIQFHLRFIGDVPSPIMWIQNKVAPLCLVSIYGPFAVITKERMEIILEGSDDGIEWKEYTFKYKPGDINRAPLWNIPFQPRLDWQMWFAALGSVDQNPWFLRFLQRILENSPDVLQLLENNPFPNQAPRFIRAQFYEYHFTNSEERKKTGAWWTRRLVRLYLPEAQLTY